MFIQFVPLVEDTHFKTFPTDPLSVSCVLFVPEQTSALLKTCPATVGGVTFTARVSFKLAQLFTSFTVMLPPAAPGTTCMIFVLVPETTLHPAGTVQLYVAPASAGTEYIALEFEHAVVSPLI